MSGVPPVGGAPAFSPLPPINTTALQNQVKDIAQNIFDQLKDGFQVSDLAPLFNDAAALLPIAASLKELSNEEKWKAIAQCIWNVIAVSAGAIKDKFPNAYNDIIAILNIMKMGTDAAAAIRQVLSVDGSKCCTCTLV